MAHKVWTFQMEDGIHTVEMDHGYYSGKKTIAVDGRVAWQDTGSSNALRNAKGTYPFQFNGHSCAINITTNGISYFYELVVEGQKVEPGQQLNPTVVQSRPPAQNGFGNYGEQAPQNIGDASYRGDPQRTEGPEAEARARYEQERKAAEIHVRSAAMWFALIAAMSVINSLIFLTGGNSGFALGLEATNWIDDYASYFAKEQGMGEGIKYAALALDLVLAGMFALFGYLAIKRQTWAFIVGMVLLALDTLLLIPSADWLSVALHGLALFFIFRGLQAAMKLRNMERAQAIAPHSVMR